MYLVLLVFGAVLTAAGIVLAASGVSIHERAFDASLVTPGIVAAVGGLVLLGLGLALRVLQRIEHVVAARPVPRATRPGEAPEAAATSTLSADAVRIPFPAKVARSAHLPQGAAIAAADQKRLELAPEKMSALARSGNTRGVGEADLSPRSLSPLMPPRTDVDSAVNNLHASRRTNGAAPSRTTPRLDVAASSLASHSPTSSERPKRPEFDTLWPKGPRPSWVTQSASAQLAAAPTAPAVEPERDSEPEFDASPATAMQDEAPEAVSVLKSGVVDGMAYTLFSDGSIEAELPQGRLRFGSIAELRNHIEQSS